MYTVVLKTCKNFNKSLNQQKQIYLPLNENQSFLRHEIRKLNFYLFPLIKLNLLYYTIIKTIRILHFSWLLYVLLTRVYIDNQTQFGWWRVTLDLLDKFVQKVKESHEKLLIIFLTSFTKKKLYQGTMSLPLHSRYLQIFIKT